MTSRVPETERFGKQNADREAERKNVRDVLRIDGSQYVRLYEKMQQLIADLETTVNDLVTDLTYTRAEIDTSLDGKATTVHGHDQGDVSGTWTKNVDNGTGGEVRTGSVYAAQAYDTDITYTRRTAWLGNDGQLGYASSSERKKTNIRPAAVDPRAVLSVEPVVFEYVAEHAERERRAALPSPYRDWNPDYPVAQEIGFIAERLDEAGLGHFVVYDSDGTPEGIEYGMWVVAQQSVLRWIVERLDSAGI